MAQDVLEYRLEAAKRKIDGQADIFNHLDTKTGVLLGFALLAVVQTLGAVFTVASGSSTLKAGHPTLLAGLVGAGLLAVVVSSILGILELMPQEFDFGGTLDGLDLAEDACCDDLKRAVLSGNIAAAGTNERILEKKARYATWSIRLLVLSVILFVVAAFTLLPTRTEGSTPKTPKTNATATPQGAQ